jgi:carbon-monoxide dehydrogenase small subunit
MKIPLTLIVNGNRVELQVEPHHSLLDVLREELDLRGAHRGCNSGDCGACTVLLDGAAIPSCLVLALDADGAEVQTVEGVAENGVLHPFQQALVQHGAIQCGYCTPGMVMAGLALLNENPHPNEDEVRTALAGNLCRCTGYKKIVEAVVMTGSEQ